MPFRNEGVRDVSRYLDQAYAERDPQLAMAASPTFEMMFGSSDPRFQDLRRRMAFPEADAGIQWLRLRGPAWGDRAPPLDKLGVSRGRSRDTRPAWDLGRSPMET